jgi:hypothetical protein
MQPNKTGLRFGAAYPLMLYAHGRSSTFHQDKDQRQGGSWTPTQEANWAANFLPDVLSHTFGDQSFHDYDVVFQSGQVILLDNRVKDGNTLTADDYQRERMEKLNALGLGKRLLSEEEQITANDDAAREVLKGQRLPEPVLVEYLLEDEMVQDRPRTSRPLFHSPELLDAIGITSHRLDTYF